MKTNKKGKMMKTKCDSSECLEEEVMTHNKSCNERLGTCIHSQTDKSTYTPTPWKLKEGLGLGSKYWVGESEDGKNTPFQSTKEANAAFIVLAVNAYEKSLAAMRKAVKDIESAMDTSTFPPSCGIPMENAKVVLELAIAKAEGK